MTLQTSTLTDWSQYMVAVGSSAATIRIRLHTVRALTRHAGVGDPLLLTRRHTLAFLARPTSQWTRVTYWRSIRAWCSWLGEFEYPHEDLLRGLPKPKTPTPTARPIEPSDIQALLAANLTRRTRAYVLLALYSGLRVHEIAKFCSEDVNIESGWMTITGKGGICKPIPIHPEITKLSADMPDMGFWFPNARGDGHVTAMAVSTTIGNALRSVGCHATAHQLRDTAATMFQRQVRDIRLTQALLRHASISSTMKYCAVSDTALQSAVNAIHYDAA